MWIGYSPWTATVDPDFEARVVPRFIFRWPYLRWVPQALYAIGLGRLAWWLAMREQRRWRG